MAAFSFGGCSTKENFEYKVKIVPQTYNSVTNLSDLNKAAEVINKRLINFFEIPEENIELDIVESQILLTLHNIDTSIVRKMSNVITSYNTLEFWETYENSEIIGYLTKADNLSRTIGSPLFNILKPRLTTTGEPLPSCMVGLASEKDTSVVNSYLKMDKIKVLLPDDLKFCWDSKPYKYDPTEGLYGLHAIKVTTADGRAPLDGSAIISAEVTTGSDKKDVKIGLTMDHEGAKTWSEITRESISRCLAVVYNDYVRSYPRVQDEITGGKTEITGDFTIEEANDFVNIFK